MLVMSLALNAQTIQGMVVLVADGDTITVLDEAKKKARLWRKENPVNVYEWRNTKVSSAQYLNLQGGNNNERF
jgi:predicted secreted protein